MSSTSNGHGHVTVNGRTYRRPHRQTVVVCIDGCDPAYLEDAFARSLIPRIAELTQQGAVVEARSQMPSFTNPNNVSIVTGLAPAGHGISGNAVLGSDGEEHQLTDPAMLRAETIPNAFHAAGVPTLVVTVKDKLRRLLAAPGVPCVSVEKAQLHDVPAGIELHELIERPVPGVYDWDCSPYALELALVLAQRLGSELTYVSLTDYVQHAHAPGTAVSDAFLSYVDQLVGAYLDAGFDMGLVADHGMNDKAGPDGSPNVRYLADELEGVVRDAQIVLPITDPHVVHHAALGSCAWVYVPASEREQAADLLAALPGVDDVLERERAARLLALPPDRIGDLVVLADRRTVLGRRDGEHDLSALVGRLRSHGGRHEQAVPLLLSVPLRRSGRGSTNADVHDLLLNA
ncbi:MAG: alkaline phosphatase family protein [Actinomycetota bacterium]|nr:alkaline phosphatase family protein [Actinomycetota bacterium]